MATRVRRPMLVLGTTILVIQALFIPIGMVYAGTTMDIEEQEQVERPSMKNYLEELGTEPQFSFTRSRMQGTVEEPLRVTFFCDQEVSEVRVRLPEEATLLKDQLPTGLSVEEGTQLNEWIIQSERVQHTFVLPLVFDKAGNYELFVEETKAQIEISQLGEILYGKSAEDTTRIDDFSENQESSNVEVENAENLEESDLRSAINVSTWAQFRSVINNNNVTAINVMANISGNTSLNIINRDLIINGNGFVIDVQRQNFRLANGRTLTVKNSIINSSITDFTPIFRASTTNSSTIVTFIFSDIVIPTSINRVVGRGQLSTNINETINVVFDGGINQFTGNTANAVVGGGTNISIKNDAIVETENRPFMEHIANDSIAVRQRTFLDIEENSKLDIRSYHPMGIVSSTINLNGILISKSPIGNSLPSTLPGKIFLGSKSSILVNTISPGLLFLDELVIERGAAFDFINSTGGEIVQNSDNFKILIDCYHFALWDLDMQNEKFSTMSFQDASLRLSGKSASIIQESNLERFNLIYSKKGLEEYSRIASLDIEELSRMVVVKYQDEIGNELAPQVKINGLLGTNYQTYEKNISGYKKINKSDNWSGVFTREKIEVVYTYEKMEPNVVLPLDPLNPEVEVDPENKPELPEEQGLLSIDFASSFNFGPQAISTHDQTYYAQPQRLLNTNERVYETKKRPNYVQISDRRPEGSRHGWQLALRQNDQFATSTGEELQGASLGFINQQLVTAQGGTEPSFHQSNLLTLVPNNRRVLIMAQGNEGTGTWIYRFGDKDTAGESVSLIVPKGALPSATAYRTTLTWELAAVPNNE